MAEVVDYSRIYNGPRAERMKRLNQTQENQLVSLHRDKQQETPISTRVFPTVERQQERKKLASTVCIWLATAMTVTSIVIIGRNAWFQGDNDWDKWLNVARDLIPEAAMCLPFGMAVHFWRQSKWLEGLYACILGAALYYVALQGVDQYNTTTLANSNQERIGKRQAELEYQYDVPTLKQRYDNALDNEKQVKTSAKSECDKLSGKGTICEKYNTTRIPSASTAKEQAWTAYNGAKQKAKNEAERELASVINKSTNALDYRKYLPLVAPALVILGSI